MNGYHCYILNKEGRVSSRHDIVTETDAEAMIKAAEIAELQENHDEPLDHRNRCCPSERKLQGCH